MNPFLIHRCTPLAAVPRIAFTPVILILNYCDLDLISLLISMVGTLILSVFAPSSINSTFLKNVRSMLHVTQEALPRPFLQYVLPLKIFHVLSGTVL